MSLAYDRPVLRLLRLAAAIAALSLLASCSDRLPKTDLLVDNVVVGALAPAAGGGILYGEKYTGEIRRVVSKGAKTDALVATKADSSVIGTLPVSKGGERGLLGLLNAEGKIYAAWTDQTTDSIVVGEVIEGAAPRIIWFGPKAANANLGGRLAMTPLKRLVVSIGDLQEAPNTDDMSTYNGKIVTLDPARGTDQRANIISKGWTDPRGITYDRGGNLWVVDGDRLARAGEQGVVGDATKLGTNVGASGLSFFADKELLVCLRANKRLERYLLVDGTTPVSGRTVAKNCAYDVVQQSGGTITYATDSTIRTAQ